MINRVCKPTGCNTFVYVQKGSINLFRGISIKSELECFLEAANHCFPVRVVSING